jgi:hypothetical protein
MTLIIPGEVLTHRIDDNARESLGAELYDIIDDLEREYSPYFRAIREWWNWYEAVPRSKTKNYPFKGASNVFVPFIKQQVDAATSRTFSTFTRGDRYWMTRTENTAFEKLAANVARRINWGARGNDFDFRTFIYDYIFSLYVVGQSVAAINYRRDVRLVHYGPTSKSREKIKSQAVEFKHGPIIENLCRENVLWDTRFPIQDAPIVVRKRLYSWSELKSMAQLDDSWDREAIEAIQGSPDDDQTYDSDDVRDEKDALALRDPDERGEYDVREAHVDWPILGRKFKFGDESNDLLTPEIPIVVHLHMRTRKVLRITAEPYHIPGKPFFSNEYRKRPGQSVGYGMPKHLEQLQSMQNTLFNQAIDAQTRANAVWAKTRNRRHMTEPLDPAHPVYVTDMEEFQELKLTPSIQGNVALITAAQVMGERTTGIADPALGRETRQGGHPSPATSTLALMEQAQILSASTEILLHHEVARMGEALAILYQQFETNEDGRLNVIFGDDDAADLEAYLYPTDPIPGNFIFDVVGVSASFNPDTQMRRAIMIGQVNQAYWGFVLQGAMVLDSPQAGPLVKQNWQKAIDASSRIYARFLMASEVDDMEKFLAEINATAVQAAQQILPGGTASPGGGTPQGLGTVQGQGSPGGAPAGPPSGANGSLAGVGVL